MDDENHGTSTATTDALVRLCYVSCCRSLPSVYQYGGRWPPNPGTWFGGSCRTQTPRVEVVRACRVGWFQTRPQKSRCSCGERLEQVTWPREMLRIAPHASGRHTTKQPLTANQPSTSSPSEAILQLRVNMRWGAAEQANGRPGEEARQARQVHEVVCVVVVRPRRAEVE